MATADFTACGPASLRRTRIHLDRARLGQMSRPAARALRDLTRLAEEEGLSLAFRALLHRGYSAWPADLRHDFPGLFPWQGISALKRSIRTLTRVPVDAGIALSARSTELVRLAARVMAARCPRILLTDLTWPAYDKIVRREAARHGSEIVDVCLRPLLRIASSPEELARPILDRYAGSCPHGLLLPAISHDGIRLPLRRMHQALSAVMPPAFFCVDGAQQLAHAPLGGLPDFCDFYVAGSHKWLGGRLPLGIGVFPRTETGKLIQRAINSEEIDDPVLAFTTGGGACSYSETVNLFPLFSCQAAASDLLRHGGSEEIHHRFKARLANARLLARHVPTDLWEMVRPAPLFRSGVMLLRLRLEAGHSLDPEELERRFQERGIALTAYEGGLVRLSLSHAPLAANDLSEITDALSEVAASLTFPSLPQWKYLSYELLTASTTP